MLPGEPGSDHFSADDQTVATPSQSASDHFSPYDASVIPLSARVSRHSLLGSNRFSVDDESVEYVERSNQSHGEPSDTEYTPISGEKFLPVFSVQMMKDLVPKGEISTPSSTISRSEKPAQTSSPRCPKPRPKRIPKREPHLQE